MTLSLLVPAWRGLLRFDLPLRERGAGRFLPWAIGGLLYCAIVSLGVAVIADQTLRSQGVGIRMVTVTLPALEDAGPDAQKMAAAIDVLRKAPGVVSAVPVASSEVAALVAPWLDNAKTGLDLSLPRLIDVTLQPGVEVDLAALEQRLRRAVAGATIGEEVVARDRAERVTVFVRGGGAAIGMLALIVNLALVGLIARANLAANAQNLELLRALGASDGYLARQFERHALLGGLQGGLFGLVLALATVLALISGSERMQLAAAADLTLPATSWLLLAGVPLVASLLATVVARITAHWGLARMP